MAFTANTGEYKVARGDIYSVDPRAIETNWKKNLARAGQEPLVDDDLKALALDMMPKKGPGDTSEGTSGQINPVVVRARTDRTLELVGGFRRMRAALWLIESELCPDFQIRYTISKMSDAECALANISENLQRKDPDAVQLAHSVRCLHEDYNMEMDVIAARLKRTEHWLKQLLGLVTLPTEIQKSVSKGRTAVTAALELAKLPSDEQIETFNAAKDSNGKVTVEGVKNQVRETREGPTPRTARHAKDFLERYTGKGEASAPLAKAFLAFFEGKPKSEERLQAAWEKVFAVPAEV